MLLKHTHTQTYNIRQILIKNIFISLNYIVHMSDKHIYINRKNTYKKSCWPTDYNVMPDGKIGGGLSVILCLMAGVYSWWVYK